MTCDAEATGIETEVVRLFDVVWVGDDPRKPADVIVYVCRPVGGTLRPASDAEDARWVPLEDLPEHVGFDNRQRILDQLPRSGW